MGTGGDGRPERGRARLGRRAALQEDARILSIIASLIAQAVRLRQSAQEERERLMEENLRLQDELKDRFRPSNIIGNSKAMQEVYQLIAQVSASDTTVLLRGESGTGKELVAHAIHYASPRAAKPFIKVNCAALPEGVIESELFGHEKGAFTGRGGRAQGPVRAGPGRHAFPRRDRGPLPCHADQAAARAAGDGSSSGWAAPPRIKADVRLIAATNRDPGRAHRDGAVPPGPVLPAERVSHPHPAPARAADRHPSPGGLLRGALQPAEPQERAAHLHAGHRHAHGLPLAGQRAGAGELHRAGGAAQRRRRDPRPPPAPDPADGGGKRHGAAGHPDARPWSAWRRSSSWRR